ncbi:MAG: hypothetical protein PHI58_02455 [Candidatus Omnitrophica bacterium]|nr:hypothetical protein [Candidatus Omnitrophota bacterium]
MGIELNHPLVWDHLIGTLSVLNIDRGVDAIRFVPDLFRAENIIAALNGDPRYTFSIVVSGDHRLLDFERKRPTPREAIIYLVSAADRDGSKHRAFRSEYAEGSPELAEFDTLMKQITQASDIAGIAAALGNSLSGLAFLPNSYEEYSGVDPDELKSWVAEMLERRDPLVRYLYRVLFYSGRSQPIPENSIIRAGDILTNGRVEKREFCICLAADQDGRLKILQITAEDIISMDAERHDFDNWQLVNISGENVNRLSEIARSAAELVSARKEFHAKIKTLAEGTRRQRKSLTETEINNPAAAQIMLTVGRELEGLPLLPDITAKETPEKLRPRIKDVRDDFASLTKLLVDLFSISRTYPLDANAIKEGDVLTYMRNGEQIFEICTNVSDKGIKVLRVNAGSVVSEEVRKRIYYSVDCGLVRIGAENMDWLPGLVYAAERIASERQALAEELAAYAQHAADQVEVKLDLGSLRRWFAGLGINVEFQDYARSKIWELSSSSSVLVMNRPDALFSETTLRYFTYPELKKFRVRDLIRDIFERSGIGSTPAMREEAMSAASGEWKARLQALEEKGEWDGPDVSSFIRLARLVSVSDDKFSKTSRWYALRGFSHNVTIAIREIPLGRYDVAVNRSGPLGVVHTAFYYSSVDIGPELTLRAGTFQIPQSSAFSRPIVLPIHEQWVKRDLAALGINNIFNLAELNGAPGRHTMNMLLKLQWDHPEIWKRLLGKLRDHSRSYGADAVYIDPAIWRPEQVLAALDGNPDYRVVVDNKGANKTVDFHPASYYALLSDREKAVIDSLHQNQAVREAFAARLKGGIDTDEKLADKIARCLFLQIGEVGLYADGISRAWELINKSKDEFTGTQRPPMGGGKAIVDIIELAKIDPVAAAKDIKVAELPGEEANIAAVRKALTDDGLTGQLTAFNAALSDKAPANDAAVRAPAEPAKTLGARISQLRAQRAELIRKQTGRKDEPSISEAEKEKLGADIARLNREITELETAEMREGAERKIRQAVCIATNKPIGEEANADAVLVEALSMYVRLDASEQVKAEAFNAIVDRFLEIIFINGDRKSAEKSAEELIALVTENRANFGGVKPNIFAIAVTTLKQIAMNFRGDVMLRGTNQSSLSNIVTETERLTGDEKGETLFLDLGGTNFRVGLVEFKGNHTLEKKHELTFAVPEEIRASAGKQLFDFIAEKIRFFADKYNLSGDLSTGFTFSFATKKVGTSENAITPECNVKGYNFDGIMGQDVAALMNEALAKAGLQTDKINIKIVKICNDTKTVKLYGMFLNPRTIAGGVFATGHNTDMLDENGNSVNLESGAFNLLEVGSAKLEAMRLDAEVDRLSSNPGVHPLEKRLSGKYVGPLFGLMLEKEVRANNLFANHNGALPATFTDHDYEKDSYKGFTARNMSEIEALWLAGNMDGLKKYFTDMGIQDPTDDDVKEVRTIAHNIMSRSARLGAATFAGIVMQREGTYQPTGEYAYAVDGPLLNYPGYIRMMKEALADIFGGIYVQKLEVFEAKDGAGIGAAIAAMAVTARDAKKAEAGAPFDNIKKAVAKDKGVPVESITVRPTPTEGEYYVTIGENTTPHYVTGDAFKVTVTDDGEIIFPAGVLGGQREADIQPVNIILSPEEEFVASMRDNVEIPADMTLSDFMGWLKENTVGLFYALPSSNVTVRDVALRLFGIFMVYDIQSNRSLFLEKMQVLTNPQTSDSEKIEARQALITCYARSVYLTEEDAAPRVDFMIFIVRSLYQRAQEEAEEPMLDWTRLDDIFGAGYDDRYMPPADLVGTGAVEDLASTDEGSSQNLEAQNGIEPATPGDDKVQPPAVEQNEPELVLASAGTTSTGIGSDEFWQRRDAAMKALESHPLITEIKEGAEEIVKARIGRHLGPGSMTLSRKDVFNIWQTINIFHQDRVEALVLQDEVGTTETMADALRDIRKKIGRDDIVGCKAFQDKEGLRKFLRSAKPEDHVKRIIVITGERSKDIVRSLVKEEPALFKEVRDLGFELPEGYNNMRSAEKTFYQSSLFMRAICARLYESDEKNPWIGMFFRNILKGCYKGDANVLLQRLPEKENETAQDTIDRIEFCSKSAIRLLSELTASAIERLKLIMREFWTAA